MIEARELDMASVASDLCQLLECFASSAKNHSSTELLKTREYLTDRRCGAKATDIRRERNCELFDTGAEE